MVNKKFAKRILDISCKHKLAHLGSCLSVLPILEEIYQQKKPGDKVFLSGAHSHLAHLVVREEYEGLQDIEGLLEKYGIHCDIKSGCDASGGSLGHGIGIAVGAAISSPKKNVYVILTDGEMSEGSCYESLNFGHERKLSNLKVYINCNGWGAYKIINRDHVVDRCRGFTNLNINFVKTEDNHFSFLKGMNAHYRVLSDLEYKTAIKELDDKS